MRNVIRKRNLVKLFKFGFRKKKRLLTSKECGWVGASKGFWVQAQHIEASDLGLV